MKINAKLAILATCLDFESFSNDLRDRPFGLVNFFASNFTQERVDVGSGGGTRLYVYDGGILATLFAIHYAQGSRSISDWWQATDSPWRNIAAVEVLQSTTAPFSYETTTQSTIANGEGWKKAVTGFFGKGESDLSGFYAAFDTFMRSTVTADDESSIDSILPSDADVVAMAAPAAMGFGVDSASGVCGKRKAN